MTPDKIREFVKQKIIEKGYSYAKVSKLLGRGPAYIHQYLTKGSPVRLPEIVRQQLCEILDVSEQELSDLPVPSSAEIDEELLVRIIRRVETYEKAKHQSYTPEYKAQLVKLIYKELITEHSADEEHDIDKIIKVSDYFKKAN